MARAAKAAHVRVRVLPRRSVLIEGRPVGAGQEADVPAADAQTLVADGYAESASKPVKPRRTTRKAPAAPKRKPLTLAAVERGERERA